MYTIQLQNSTTREKIQQKLANAGILTKIYFSPIHLKTFYQKNYNYKKGDLPITEEISKKVLTLPLYPTMKVEEMDNVINEIKKSL
jgi:perosamine synthetase